MSNVRRSLVRFVEMLLVTIQSTLRLYRIIGIAIGRNVSFVLLARDRHSCFCLSPKLGNRIVAALYDQPVEFSPRAQTDGENQLMLRTTGS
jgi:hypothetical protein